ncbi:MAG: RNA polymerase sigma-70 factor ECF [Geobacteraceae bacterium]|nr:MAG: RNA polymerase sigma-70 factor ECF [Geobacteraceae bacterium]
MSRNTTELFDQLYRDNEAKVYRLAFALAGNVHDAEDITHEAFSRAYCSYHTFREESSFFTWICRITLNVAKDYLKYRTKFPIHSLTEDLGYSLEEVIDSNPANNPETELLAHQAKIRCLHSLTECLQANERKVFCLAITLGLPQRQVADIMDCSINSVKVTLHRAKKRWLGYMEGRCQLMKKSNPCNCKQWIRFGLSQGWISKQASADSHSPVAVQAKEEISRLKTLRDLYQDLYLSSADASLAKRIREGIQNREWEIFS